MVDQPLVEDVDEVKSEGQDENLNVRAAIVHMVGDMVQSLGVIIAAVIIYVKPDWTIADPICTFLFSILVMMTTIPIFSDCMTFLMETSPEAIDSKDVYNAIMDLDMVKEIHDFHLWSLSDEKPIFTAHVVVIDAASALHSLSAGPHGPPPGQGQKRRGDLQGHHASQEGPLQTRVVVAPALRRPARPGASVADDDPRRPDARPTRGHGHGHGPPTGARRIGLRGHLVALTPCRRASL